MLKDTAALGDGYAACRHESLQCARGYAIKNFTKWVCEIKEDKTIQDVEGYVKVWCDDTMKDIYARLEGTTKRDKYSTNMDMALFSRNMDILFVIMCTKSVLYAPSYLVYTHSRRGIECAFAGQLEKKRAVVVILHRGHYDLFSVCVANKRLVVFGIGTPTDDAMRLAFAHIKQYVPKSQERPWGAAWTPTAPPKRQAPPAMPLEPKALQFFDSPHPKANAIPISTHAISRSSKNQQHVHEAKSPTKSPAPHATQQTKERKLTQQNIALQQAKTVHFIQSPPPSTIICPVNTLPHMPSKLLPISSLGDSSPLSHQGHPRALLPSSNPTPQRKNATHATSSTPQLHSSTLPRTTHTITLLKPTEKDPLEELFQKHRLD